MSDFSLTLVLQIKTSKIINDMAKVQQNLRKSPLLNRDGNANVRFMQAETHRRFFEMMRSFGIHNRQNRRNQE